MKSYYLQTVKALRPGDGYRLAVEFEDGFEAEIDMRPWIDRGGVRAAMIAPELFAQVKVEDGAPEWPGEVDLSPGTLRAWCEAGRVLSINDTNEWVKQHSEPIEGVA